MNITIQLALRNLFRNKKRTWLTLTLIACSVAAMMMMQGLMEGMKTSMITSSTRMFPGDAQVHKGDYHLSRNDQLIFDYKTIEQKIKQVMMPQAIAPRIYQTAMMSSSRHNTSVLLVGVEPLLEGNFSKLRDAIVEGEFLTQNNSDSREVLLGYQLAKELTVELGDRIVVSVPQVESDGELGSEIAQGLFRVSGIFKFNAQRMDKGWAFISLKRGQTLLNIESKVHEVAINYDRNNIDHEQVLNKSLSFGSGITLKYWPELLPELDAMLSMTNTSLWIMGLILFVIAALGIINTLFMSIYERMWEFAVIKAVGNTPSEVFLMIIWEALLLGLLGVAVGILMGCLGNIWLGAIGIDYSNMEFSGAAIVEPIRPEMHLIQFVHIPIISLGLVLASALYPAWFACRIVPASALHKSL
ncbi:ABC transporter permease [Bermanella sp. R86510]|uniref:ABC transporter permease n=1 Tax=unclassified Bermanella TaxID=2627862 RepID=UPI0037CB9050